ncbi:MAG: hypothetical protein ABR600_14640, partial [Actinomycetota bacterium]
MAWSRPPARVPLALRLALPLGLLIGTLAPSTHALAAGTVRSRWADVPARFWARQAIDVVARANP